MDMFLPPETNDKVIVCYAINSIGSLRSCWSMRPAAPSTFDRVVPGVQVEYRLRFDRRVKAAQKADALRYFLGAVVACDQALAKWSVAA